MSAENSSKNCMHVQVSYKTFFIGLSIFLSAILGGNAGMNFLINPAMAEQQITDLSERVETHITLTEQVRTSQQVLDAELRAIKSDTANKTSELKVLQELVRENARQLNQLIGRVDSLLAKQG